MSYTKDNIELKDIVLNGIIGLKDYGYKVKRFNTNSLNEPGVYILGDKRIIVDERVKYTCGCRITCTRLCAKHGVM
jgi:hypothetical protein